ncbi:MAG TPA: DUF1257 domain-containing protein [Phycisphaerae bacterium]|nr:DUF1257 domain-containing protein [Phycisphaerales bacterium]HRX85987.1 DUF1257 domain-containing protein [Phycisphaerae bacterium]
MGAVLVLTPLVVASWPAISAAVFGAAAAMGFSVAGPLESSQNQPRRTNSVETEIEDSSVVAEELQRGTQIALEKDGVHIAFGQDDRGACTVCVTGDRPQRELRAIGEDVAGRVVQQFAYHRLMTELKQRNYSIVDEQVMQDDSIQVRVRL